MRSNYRLSSLSVAAFPLLAGMLAFAPATAAETITSKTRGVTFATVENLNHADGTIGQLFRVKFVEDITEGSHMGETWSGECWGSGLVAADGAYAGQLRCTTAVTADDAFTFQVDHDTAEGGDYVITGGKGKFAGATGKGFYKHYWGDAVFGDKLAWTGEMTLELK